MTALRWLSFPLLLFEDFGNMSLIICEKGSPISSPDPKQPSSSLLNSPWILYNLPVLGWSLALTRVTPRHSQPGGRLVQCRATSSEKGPGCSRRMAPSAGAPPSGCKWRLNPSQLPNAAPSQTGAAPCAQSVVLAWGRSWCLLLSRLGIPRFLLTPLDPGQQFLRSGFRRPLGTWSQ